jgi:hypothetical protein
VVVAAAGVVMTDTEPPFFMAGCEVLAYDDNKHVKLIFSDRNDDTRSVVLHREQIPAIAGALQAEVATGNVVPIDQASLQIGANYRLEGFSIQKRQDNSA